MTAELLRVQVRIAGKLSRDRAQQQKAAAKAEDRAGDAKVVAGECVAAECVAAE
ncbi:hypothetical protein D3C81_2042450 [compost metagenome]